MNYFFRSIFILCFAFLCHTLSGQVEIEGVSSQAVVVETNDGGVIYGFITGRDDEFMYVESASIGNVRIPVSEITRVKYIDNVTNILFDNSGNQVDFHNSTHYFLFPSGYALKKGQSYYENIMIFANSYSYGLTDNFMISVGAEIASLLFASQTPVVYVSPKLSVPFENQKGALGINATILTTGGDGSLGFLSGSLTLGSRNNNVTVGVGGGFNFDNGITDEVIPMTLSGMFRLGPKISLLTENWFILQDDLEDFAGVGSIGLRIHFKSIGNALNVGLARPLTGDALGLIGIPFVSATVAIGK